MTPRPGRLTYGDVGVLYLDLDGFKPVNDTYRHDAGDEVLLTAAHRLRAVLRPQDTAARLGGDEFAVVAPRITEVGLQSLADRIDTELAAPHIIHGHVSGYPPASDPTSRRRAKPLITPYVRPTAPCTPPNADAPSPRDRGDYR